MRNDATLIEENNLDYFKEYMPEIEYQKANLVGDELCSICLG
jgi:hypothetical protein